MGIRHYMGIFYHLLGGREDREVHHANVPPKVPHYTTYSFENMPPNLQRLKARLAREGLPPDPWMR